MAADSAHASPAHLKISSACTVVNAKSACIGTHDKRADPSVLLSTRSTLKRAATLLVVHTVAQQVCSLILSVLKS